LEQLPTIMVDLLNLDLLTFVKQVIMEHSFSLFTMVLSVKIID